MAPIKKNEMNLTKVTKKVTKNCPFFLKLFSHLKINERINLSLNEIPYNMLTIGITTGEKKIV